MGIPNSLPARVSRALVWAKAPRTAVASSASAGPAVRPVSGDFMVVLLIRRLSETAFLLFYHPRSPPCFTMIRASDLHRAGQITKLFDRAFIQERLPWCGIDSPHLMHEERIRETPQGVIREMAFGKHLSPLGPVGGMHPTDVVVRDGKLWIDDGDGRPAEITPVGDSGLEFEGRDDNNGAVKVTFVKDDSGAVVKMHLLMPDAGLDVCGNKVNYGSPLAPLARPVLLSSSPRIDKPSF